MEMIREKLDALFEELVPPMGKADSLAGEIIRAVSRIGYRFFNDGDQLGIGYGKETCDPAGRFLIKRTNDKIADIASGMFGLYAEEKYEEQLKDLLYAVAEYMAEERGGPRGWKVDYCYMYSAPEILPMDYLALLKLTEDNPPPTGALNELNEDVIIESGCNEMGKFFRLTTCQHNGWMRINYIYEDGSREELYEK